MGHLQVVKELLTNGQIDVNAGNPLHWAAQRGHLKVVKELLVNDEVDVNVNHPLHWATKGTIWKWQTNFSQMTK
jgi:ankyrin repeat protein